MQAPDPRRALGVAPEALQVALHARLVEHVGGHDRAAAAGRADDVVVARRPPRRPRRRLRRVVGLVPRREHAHARERRAEALERPPVAGGARRAAVPRLRVAAVPAPARGGEGDEHLLAGGGRSGSGRSRRAGSSARSQSHGTRYRTRFNRSCWNAGARTSTRSGRRCRRGSARHRPRPAPRASRPGRGRGGGSGVVASSSNRATPGGLRPAVSVPT